MQDGLRHKTQQGKRFDEFGLRSPHPTKLIASISKSFLIKTPSQKIPSKQAIVLEDF